MHLWPEVTSANYIRPSVGGQFCGFDPGTAPISSQASRPFRQSMQLLLGLLFRRPNLVQYMYIHVCMIFSGHKCNICEGGAAQKYGENLQGDPLFGSKFVHMISHW